MPQPLLSSSFADIVLSFSKEPSQMSLIALLLKLSNFDHKYIDKLSVMKADLKYIAVNEMHPLLQTDF